MNRIQQHQVNELLTGAEQVSERCAAALDNPRGGFMSDGGTFRLLDGRYMQVFRDSFGFKHGLIGNEIGSVRAPVKGGSYARWAQ